jgi:hypothetical protein
VGQGLEAQITCRTLRRPSRCVTAAAVRGLRSSVLWDGPRLFWRRRLCGRSASGVRPLALFGKPGGRSLRSKTPASGGPQT